MTPASSVLLSSSERFSNGNKEKKMEKEILEEQPVDDCQTQAL